MGAACAYKLCTSLYIYMVSQPRRLQSEVVILFRHRPQLLGHRQALLEQLTSSADPALVLHLTALILFQAMTQTMLHASGRFVSNILTYLQPHLSAEVFNTLQRYHGEFFVLFFIVIILSSIGSIEACCRYYLTGSFHHFRVFPSFFLPVADILKYFLNSHHCC